MTCQKCGKNNRSSHKCVDDVVYAPEKENKKMSESDKLLLTFQKALDNNPFLAFEIGYTRITDWMVHIWDHKGTEISNGIKIIETQDYDKEEACKRAREKLEDYLNTLDDIANKIFKENTKENNQYEK